MNRTHSSVIYLTILTTQLLISISARAGTLQAIDIDLSLTGTQIYEFDGAPDISSTIVDFGGDSDSVAFYFTPSTNYTDSDYLVFNFFGSGITNTSISDIVLAVPGTDADSSDTGVADVYMTGHSAANNYLLVFQPANGLTLQAGQTYEIRNLKLNPWHFGVSVSSYGVESNRFGGADFYEADFDESAEVVIAVAGSSVRNQVSKAAVNYDYSDAIAISRQGYEHFGQSTIFFRFMPTVAIGDADLLRMSFSGAELAGNYFADDTYVYEANFRGVDLIGSVPTDNGIPQADEINVLNATSSEILISPKAGTEIEAFSQVAFIVTLEKINGPIYVRTETIKSGEAGDQSDNKAIVALVDQISVDVTRKLSRKLDFRNQFTAFVAENGFSDNFTDTLSLSIEEKSFFTNIGDYTTSGWSAYAIFYKLDIHGTDFDFLLDEKGQLDHSKIVLRDSHFANSIFLDRSDVFRQSHTEALILENNVLSLYISALYPDFDIQFKLDDGEEAESVALQDFTVDVSLLGYEADEDHNFTSELIVPAVQNQDAGAWQSNGVELSVPYFKYTLGDHRFMYLSNASVYESGISLTVLDSANNTYETFELTQRLGPKRIISVFEEVDDILEETGFDLSEPFSLKFEVAIPANSVELTVGTNRRGQKVLHRVTKTDNGS